MKYKHIIWDWNGTLLDDVWLCVEIVNRLLSNHDRPHISQAFHKDNFEFPIEDYYANLGFDFKKESFQILTDKFIGTYRHRVRECDLHNGTGNVLNHLEDLGCTQSILSAAEQTVLNEMVTHFGLDKHFGKILGLKDNLARSKVEIGKQKVESLDYDPAEIVYIGDTMHDYEVAELMGVKSILVSHGHHSHKKLSRSGITVIESLDELIEQIV